MCQKTFREKKSKNSTQNLIQRECSICIYDERVPNITFDSDGVCNYCHQIDELKSIYGTGTNMGERKFDNILADVRRAGRGKKYDCIVGLSGGTDSSYLILKAKEWGLRVLAVHYDNTWNSATASMNIAKVTKACNVDLWTHVVDNSEVDDIKYAFLKAGVREFDADTDIGLVQTIRAAAAKFGVKYIFEGHSFITEGLSPVGSNYLDGMYVAEIHRIFGKEKSPSFPNMMFWDFLRWTLLHKQKFIRPFWYLSYDKDIARKELQEKTGWEYYGGHHLENFASMFAHTVWLPQKFNLDYRNLTLAANVRSGKISKNEAKKIYNTPILIDGDLVDYVKKRVGLSDAEYLDVLNGTERSWRDFKTYKKRFEVLRPLFKLMADADLVPRSFYLKYCFPIGE